jgi:hypothetical protein
MAEIRYVEGCTVGWDDMRAAHPDIAIGQLRLRWWPYGPRAMRARYSLWRNDATNQPALKP